MTTEPKEQIKDLPALPPARRAAVVLKSDDVAKELADLVESSRSITAITNADGRAECHAAAMRAKAARVSIEKAGKDARDDANAFSKAVIAEEKRLVGIIEPEQNRLLALRDGWDAKIEAEKEAKRREEAEKAAAITRKIDAIRNIPLEQIGKTATEIRAAMQYVKSIEIDDSYGDQFGAAKEARGDVILRLVDMADAAEQRAADAARAAEEKRIADAKAEQERIEREAEARRQREEAERLRAENERIRAENEAAAKKLREEREAFDRQMAAAEERARIQQDQQKKTDQATVSPNGASSTPTAVLTHPADAAAQDPAPAAVSAAPAAASVTDSGPLLNLGQINTRLGFTVTAGFLSSLGVEPRGTDKRAVLYSETDFRTACDRIAAHCLRVGGFTAKRAA